MALGSYILSCIDQAERHGKEHNIKFKALDSAKWVTGYVVFIGCAAIIWFVPMMIIYILYANGFWNEKVKQYLYTVSD